MEFCELDLFEAVMQNGGFPDRVVRDIFGQLCDGLAHCHSRGYFHRDIKPENCLVDMASMTVKLTDFGLVTRDTWSREMGCGSARYLAPEACASADGSRGYSPAASDIWALGIVLINLLFSKNPWYEATPTDPIFSQFIGSDPDILRRQFDLTPELDQVLRRVFSLDPAMRLPLSELKRQILSVPRFVKINNAAPVTHLSQSASTTFELLSNTSAIQSPFASLPRPDRPAPSDGPLVALDHPLFPPKPASERNDNGNPYKFGPPTPIPNNPSTSVVSEPALLLSKELSNLDIVVEPNPFISGQPSDTSIHHSLGRGVLAQTTILPAGTPPKIADAPYNPFAEVASASSHVPLSANEKAFDSLPNAWGLRNPAERGKDQLVLPTTPPEGPIEPLLMWAQPSRQTPLVPGNLSLGREGIGRLGISRLTHSRNTGQKNVKRRQNNHRNEPSNAFSVAAAALHPLANAIAGWTVWATVGWGGSGVAGLDGMPAATNLMPGAYTVGETSDLNAPLLLTSVQDDMSSGTDYFSGDGMEDDDDADGFDSRSESLDGEERVPDEEDPYESVRHDRRRVPDLETGGNATPSKILGLRRTIAGPVTGIGGGSGFGGNQVYGGHQDKTEGDVGIGKFIYLRDEPSGFIPPPLSAGSLISGTDLKSPQGYTASAASILPFFRAGGQDSQAKHTGAPLPLDHNRFGAGAVVSKNIRLGAGDAGMIQVDGGWDGSGLSSSEKPERKDVETQERSPDNFEKQRRCVEKMVEDAAAAASLAAAEVLEVDNRNMGIIPPIIKSGSNLSSLPLSSTAGILFVTTANPYLTSSSSSSSSDYSVSSLSSSIASPTIAALTVPLSESPLRPSLEPSIDPRYEVASSVAPSRRHKSQPPSETRMSFREEKVSKITPIETKALYRSTEQLGGSSKTEFGSSSRRQVVGNKAKKASSSDDIINSPSIRDFEALSKASIGRSGISSPLKASLNSSAEVGAEREDPSPTSGRSSFGNTFGLRGGFAQIYDASLGLLVGGRKRNRRKKYSRSEVETGDADDDEEEDEGDDGFESGVSAKDVEGGHRKTAVFDSVNALSPENKAESKPHPHRHRHKDVHPRRFSIPTPTGETLLPPPPVSIAIVAAAIPSSEMDRNNADFEKLVLATQRQYAPSPVTSVSTPSEAFAAVSPERKESSHPSLQRGRHRFRRHREAEQGDPTSRDQSQMRATKDDREEILDVQGQKQGSARKLVSEEDEAKEILSDGSAEEKAHGGKSKIKNFLRGGLNHRRKSSEFSESLWSTTLDSQPLPQTNSQSNWSTLPPLAKGHYLAPSTHTRSSRRPSYAAQDQAYHINSVNPNAILPQSGGGMTEEPASETSLPLFNSSNPYPAEPKEETKGSLDLILPLHSEADSIVKDALPGQFPRLSRDPEARSTDVEDHIFFKITTLDHPADLSDYDMVVEGDEDDTDAIDGDDGVVVGSSQMTSSASTSATTSFDRSSASRPSASFEEEEEDADEDYEMDGYGNRKGHAFSSILSANGPDRRYPGEKSRLGHQLRDEDTENMHNGPRVGGGGGGRTLVRGAYEAFKGFMGNGAK
ncbi:hypothetical protein HDU67_008572 [Dinochytrium kinnereticum]|nr:hypothetical protein HDU67_008572 [Dinochytrium kinnereticum]